MTNRLENTGDIFPTAAGTVITTTLSALAGDQLVAVASGGFTTYDQSVVLAAGARGSYKAETASGTTTTAGIVQGNWDNASLSATILLRLGVAPTTDVTLAVFYDTAGATAFRIVRVGSSGNIRLLNKAGSTVASIPTYSITAGVTLLFQTRVAKGTGTTDGVFQLNVTNVATGAVVFTYSSTALDTGTVNYRQVHWGKMSATGASGTGVQIWLQDATAEADIAGFAAQFQRGPAGGKYHAILLTGASNMVGRATDAGTVDTYPSNVWTIPQRGAHQGILVKATEYLRHPDPSAGLGPANTFVADYAAALLPADEHVVLMPAAYGGTGFTVPDSNGASMTWRADAPDDANNRLLYATRLVAATLALCGAGSKLVAILHNAGSTDGTNNTPQATYRSYLTAMIQTLRTALGSTVPFLMMQSRPDLIAAESRHRIIDDVQRAIAGVNLNAGTAPDPTWRLDYTGYAPGPVGSEFYGADAVHYNAAGQRQNGHRLFAVLDDAQANHDPDVPDPDSPSGIYVGRFAVQTYVGNTRVA